jgi:hypothetical protein
MFNVGGPCDDIAHAGQAAPLPMVVYSLVYPRDERGHHLIQQQSSDKNEASGTHAESPSPRLPAIQTLHNRGEGAGPLLAEVGPRRPADGNLARLRARKEAGVSALVVKTPASIRAGRLHAQSSDPAMYHNYHVHPA